MRSSASRSMLTKFLPAILLGLWLASASLIGCGETTDDTPDEKSQASTQESKKAQSEEKQLVVVEGGEELEQVQFAKDEANEDPSAQPNASLAVPGSETAVPKPSADPSLNPRKGKVSNVGHGGGGGGSGRAGGTVMRRSRGGGGAPKRAAPEPSPSGGNPALELGETDGETDDAENEKLNALREAQTIAMRRMMGARQGELWARPVIEDMEITRELIAFPLKETRVHAQISGFVAQTDVVQRYENPFDEAIEATYVFPLPEDSAVNGYKMKIGSRVIIGLIRKKEEAREIYEEAKRQGYRAALLEQERPNIFVQNIANIAAKEAIEVELSFMNRLKREGGTYKWHFPMTVTPRFNAEKKIDPAMVPDQRTGNDISLKVDIDAGLPIGAVRVPSHEYRYVVHAASQYTIELAPHEKIPNKDFALEFDVIGAEMQTGLITHADGQEGFAALMISPPSTPAPEMIGAREVILLIDCSGSMRGEPIEILKNLSRKIIDGLRFDDTFNIIAYSGTTKKLWESSQPATTEHREEASAFLEPLQGSGGTNMDLGVSTMLQHPREEGRMRVVAFLTDGHVGNEDEVLGIIRQREQADTRVFAFGIGSSVNRYLLEQIGKQGQGHTEILLSDNYERSERATMGFFRNMATPVLTHIELEWEGFGELDIQPRKLPDLYADKPVSIVARYDASTGPLSGTLTIKGFLGGQPHQYSIEVDLPAHQPENAGLSALWAREKIASLTEDRYGLRDAEIKKALTEEITETALAYGIVSEGTSFVAVDEQGGTTSDGAPKRVKQGNEAPKGVDPEGITGE